MSDDDFTTSSLRYRKTRLLCPNCLSTEPVITVTEAVAMLACGCSRPESLPVKAGKVSVEALALSSKEQQKITHRLFPASIKSLKTTRNRFGRVAEYAAA